MKWCIIQLYQNGVIRATLSCIHVDVFFWFLFSLRTFLINGYVEISRRERAMVTFFFLQKISIRFQKPWKEKAPLINLAMWLKVSVYIISHVSFRSSRTIGYNVAAMEGWIFWFGAISEHFPCISSAFPWLFRLLIFRCGCAFSSVNVSAAPDKRFVWAVTWFLHSKFTAGIQSRHGFNLKSLTAESHCSYELF